MGILSRYFLASYLRLFVVVLAVSLLAVVVVEMLVNFDEIVEHRKTLGGPFAYLLVRVPALYLRELVPAASFAAGFLCLGVPALRREVLAVKSGGIAPPRLALPILAAAALLSCATLLLNETFLLGATREFTRLEHPDESVVYGRDSFWYHRGDAFYNVRGSHPDDRTLEDVRIFRLADPGRLAEALHAERATVDEGDRWRLFQATRLRFDPDAPERPPRVEQLADAEVEMGAGDDFALLQASAELLSLEQLQTAIALSRSEQRNPTRYLAILHARLATPFTVLVFALLALPIGLSVERTRNLALSSLYGITAVGGFYAAWHVGTLVGRSGFAFAAGAPWVVLAATAVVSAVWLLTRSPR